MGPSPIRFQKVTNCPTFVGVTFPTRNLIERLFRVNSAAPSWELILRTIEQFENEFNKIES